MGPLSTLLKIQELEMVLKESAIVHSDKDMETGNLEEQIENLTKDVPEKTLLHYQKIKKNGLGIAQEIQGYCRACHMTIPVGNLNRIQSGKDEPTCPTCSVFLFAEIWGEDK